MIYLSHSFPIERILKSINYEEIKLNYPTLKFVSLRRLMQPDYVELEEYDKECIELKTLDELKIFLTNNNCGIILTDLGINYETLKIFRLLRKYRSFVVHIDYSTDRPVAALSKKRLLKISFKNHFKNWIIKLNLLSGLISEYNSRITRVQCDDNFPYLQSVCSTDVYNTAEFLRRDRKKDMNEKTIVFLDVFLPFHQDYKLWGIESINAEKYYFRLNSFFDLLEKRYGADVIIAAHPSADYPINFFDGRPIRYNDTIRLIYNSLFCVSHQSTSTSIAVLFDKEILFVHTDEMMEKFSNSTLAAQIAVAEELGGSSLNIEHIDEIDTLNKTKLCTYESYIKNYLSRGFEWKNASRSDVSNAIIKIVEFVNSKREV